MLTFWTCSCWKPWPSSRCAKKRKLFRHILDGGAELWPGGEGDGCQYVGSARHELSVRAVERAVAQDEAGVGR